jgi:hypothetical protein
MLQEFVQRMCSDLRIGDVPKMSPQKTFEFILNPEVKVNLIELNPGISMQAAIAPCPERKKEDLFMLLMSANFLGQGTAGARIGLDGQEKLLTLSLGLPYELEYSDFKQHLEDFVNYLVYWRERIAKIEQEETLI